MALFSRRIILGQSFLNLLMRARQITTIEDMPNLMHKESINQSKWIKYIKNV